MHDYPAGFSPWHIYNPKLINEVIDKGDELLKLHEPQADFVSIGQSPAWLCRTASLLGRAKGNASRFCYVPFSKSFGTRVLSKEGDDIVATFDIMKPQHLRQYRRRLQKRELCPSQIIHSYRKGGRPTVFIDYVRSGRGLGSFMHMMYSWAAEEGPEKLQDFINATRVHILKENTSAGIDIMRFPDLNLSIRPSVQRVSENFTHHFADSAHDSPDRLVGFYPDKEWHHGSPDKNDAGLLGEIGGTIARAVSKRIGASTRCSPTRRVSTKFAGFTAEI